MLLGGLLVGAGLAAGSFVYARKLKKASKGQSAAIAAVGGATGYGAVWVVSALFSFPVLLAGGAVAGGYYYLRRRQHQKALPPASSG